MEIPEVNLDIFDNQRKVPQKYLDYQGCNVDDLRMYFKKKKIDIIVREIEKDGEPQIITMDLRFNRLNVHTFNGIITKINENFY